MNPQVSATATLKDSYRLHRQARRQQQADRLERVLALPKAEQAAALWAQWPQKLPKQTRRSLPKDLRTAWKECKIQQLIRKHPEMMEAAMADRYGLYMTLMMAVATDRYRDTVAEMMMALRCIPGEKQIAVQFSAGEATREVQASGSSDSKAGAGLGADFFMDSNGALESPEAADLLAGGIALGLENSGALIVRQRLPLKVMRRNAAGHMAWEHQERVYGAFFGPMGLGAPRWQSMSVHELRENCSLDRNTGEPIDLPLGLQFGDMGQWLSKPKGKSH